MINDNLQNRRRVIRFVITIVFVVFIARLFSVQVVENEYKKKADSNAFFKKTQYPPRGLIYDRNNKLLVYNKPAYDIILIMREIENLDTLALCDVLKIDKEYFINKINEIKDKKKNRGYSSYTPQVFMTQLDSRDIASLQQSLYRFSGFYVQDRALREYAYNGAAHVLGNIGEVSQTQIEKDDYYRPGDYAGRDGIEYTYEKSLRGEKGFEIFLRDAKGRIKGKYLDGEEDIKPKAGKDLTLTVDIDLQMFGEKLMTGKVGSIVAIEPNTGEILAMVTNPGFSPSLLVGRQRGTNYTTLLNDPTRPLFNRATQATYPPGSTFKILEALVCQQLGGITENTYFPCSGAASTPIKCTHSHGSPVSLLNAIEQSCNPYFWNAFKATVEKGGYGKSNATFRKNYNVWRETVKSFGLGEKFTDSDIYEQSRGNIPSEDYFNKIYRSESGWRAVTIRSLSIGQGEVLATPLQMANLMCAVANEGYYIAPHLNKCDSMLQKVHQGGVEQHYYPIVKEGMWRVFESGTARYYRIPDIPMCGKTGTADNSHGKPHSFFVGYAPRENPQIAICVVVENAGFGSTYAAPIFSLLIEKYITGEIKREELETRIINTVTNQDVTAR